MTASSRRSILVTGATGTVGLPIVTSLAAEHEVVAVARFSDDATRQKLEAAGVRCVRCDLTAGSVDGIPRTVDHLVNLARPEEPPLGSPWAHRRSTAAHANGLALLMTHCTGLVSVLHCSSTSMYSRDHQPAREDDAITDDRHPRRPTYTLAKIGAEAVMSALSVALGVPATVARLNVPYSNSAGWPAAHLRTIMAGAPVEVHPRRPNAYNPIHTDDMARHVVPLLDAARSPVVIVNWAGFETVSIEEWATYLGGLVGWTPTFVESPDATEPVTVDTTRLRKIVGADHVPWRDGMRRLAMTITHT